MTDPMTLQELAGVIGGSIVGGHEEDTVVRGVSTLQDACPDEICYYGNRKYASFLGKTSALAVIVSEPCETSARCLIVVKDAYDAFRKALEIFPRRLQRFQRSSSSAVVHPPLCWPGG